MKALLIRTRRWALSLTLVLALVGGGMVLRHWQHIGQHNWEPLAIPFTITEGESISGEFVAALSEPHEVEIEIDWVLPDEVLDRLIYVDEGIAPIDIDWMVKRGADIISQGDCRDYLYLSEGGYYKKSKLKEALLNIPFHRESPSGTISRGVGKFDAEAGVAYTVSAKVNASMDELKTTNPRFVARINRAFWTRSMAETQRMAFAGYVFLAFAGMSFLWFLLGSLCRRRNQTS